MGAGVERKMTMETTLICLGIIALFTIGGAIALLAFVLDGLKIPLYVWLRAFEKYIKVISAKHTGSQG